MDVCRTPESRSPAEAVVTSLFKHPGGHIQNRQDKSAIAPGIDVKANGGFFVAAPSLHSSGNRYQWDGLEDTGIAELPGWLKQLLVSKPTTNGKAKSSGSSEKFTEGKRHQALLSYAGKLRHAGCGSDEILAALLEFNRHRCSPPKSETEVRKLAEDIAQRYATDGSTTESAPPPARNQGKRSPVAERWRRSVPCTGLRERSTVSVRSWRTSHPGPPGREQAAHHRRHRRCGNSSTLDSASKLCTGRQGQRSWRIPVGVGKPTR